MSYLEYTSFDKQKKSAKKHPTLKDKSDDVKKVVIVRRRHMETLYVQQYSANSGLQILVYKKTLVLF